MKALIIVILILTVLALVPLGVDGGYSGEKFVLGLRLGLFNIRLYPRKLRRRKPKAPKKKPEKKKPEKKKPSEANAQKKKSPLDKKKLFRIAKIGLKALGRLRRRLHVDYLRIRYTFATDDPFNTAMGFGYSSAAISAILPLFDDAFDIDKRDIGTSFDFLSDKPAFDCWLTLTIQVWEIFYFAAALGIDYLKIKYKQKKEDRIRKE